MRALVPVSVRTQATSGTRSATSSTVMRGPLPVYIDDPVARLRFVRTAMDGLKESKQAVGAATLARGQQPRAADRARAGLAAELLHPAVQPDRDQHPRPADAAVRARAPADGSVPGRVPARGPRAGDRDHVLQRRHRLRAARRLRRAARHRPDRRRESTPRCAELLARRAQRAAAGARRSGRSRKLSNGGAPASRRRRPPPAAAAPTAQARRRGRRRSCPTRRPRRADPRPTCAPSASAAHDPRASAATAEQQAGHDGRRRSDQTRRDRLPARADRGPAEDRPHRAEVAVRRPRPRGARRPGGRAPSVLGQASGEHEIRAIDLDRELTRRPAAGRERPPAAAAGALRRGGESRRPRGRRRHVAGLTLGTLARHPVAHCTCQPASPRAGECSP